MGVVSDQAPPNLTAPPLPPAEKARAAGGACPGAERKRKRRSRRGSTPAVAEAMVGLLPYQRSAVLNPARFSWNCWARQTGKSFTFSLRRLVRGLARRRSQILLSAGERQSREIMHKVRQHCAALRIWCDFREIEGFDGAPGAILEARLSRGVRIIALPANPQTARGFSGDVFLDEFAMHGDDAAVWAALFPSLLRGHGELDVASTPRGCSNLFYRLATNERFCHSTVTLAAAAAQGLETDMAALREAVDSEEIWRQEFCCEFVDEAGSFMPYELIRSCQDAGIDTDIDWAALGRRDLDVYAGVDIGRRHDLTALWLWRRDGRALVTCGVAVMANAPFREQAALLERVLVQPSVRRLAIDATGMGLMLAEELERAHGGHRVEAVNMSAGRKSQLAGGLRVMAERGLLRIPADAAIGTDWHSIARTATATGQVRFDAARTAAGHGDRFWAAALGVSAASEAPGRAEYAGGERLAFAREGIW